MDVTIAMLCVRRSLAAWIVSTGTHATYFLNETVASFVVTF